MTISPATGDERELIIERRFEAPRQLVFDAWKNAESVARWFGPKDFTAPFCEVNFRVGGKYRICMLSPEGVEHWVEGEYKEIVEPERIVFTWNRQNPSGEVINQTRVEIDLTDLGDRTGFRLWQGVFETEIYRDGHGFGWGQSLDRLETFVGELKHTEEE